MTVAEKIKSLSEEELAMVLANMSISAAMSVLVVVGKDPNVLGGKAFADMKERLIKTLKSDVPEEEALDDKAL